MTPTLFSAAHATAADLAWSCEVDDIPGDVLGPLDDATEGTALVRGPRKSMLEGFLGRHPVRGRPHSVPPDCYGGDPGICLRREVARRRARPAKHGRHSACRPA